MSADEIILIGRKADAASDAAERLTDGIIVALQEFDRETLLAISAYRESMHTGCWMARMIDAYVEVWR